MAENVRGLLSSEDGRFFRGILEILPTWGLMLDGVLIRPPWSHIDEQFSLQEEGAQQRYKGSKAPRELYDGSIEDWSGRCSIYEPKLCRTFNGVPAQVDMLRQCPATGYPIKAIAEIERALNEESE